MRADKYFARRFGSRTKAREALERGLVLHCGKPLSPADDAEDGEDYDLLGELDFVSNGGYKLERGLSRFQESVEGCVVADLGASTGGFCDCLLRRGAKTVFCVDVGESQLAPSLACDGRVVAMDRTNARYLSPGDFPLPIDVITSDLSFISLRLVLPAVSSLLREGGRAFVLFKPQFECEGKGLGKSGILPQSRHASLLSEFYDFCVALRLAPQEIVNAPLRKKKNVEYLVFLKKDAAAIGKAEFLAHASQIL